MLDRLTSFTHNRYIIRTRKLCMLQLDVLTGFLKTRAEGFENLKETSIFVNFKYITIEIDQCMIY